MAEQSKKIKHGLDEILILTTGAQILVGFEYRSTLEKGFEALPLFAQYLKLSALGLMLITICLLLAVPTYHQIACRGEATKSCQRFITWMAGLCLLPFALGLGLDFYVVTEKILGTVAGIIFGVALALVALFFWYGLEAMRKDSQAREQEKQEKQQAENGSPSDKGEGDTKLADKIEHVLTEARVVLPGVQALLGFQFASILIEGFDKLPESSKYIHLGCLVLMALSTVLLMTPAAYHRLVEHGEDSEHFHRFASRVLLASMVPLALGISGDFYVVIEKVTQSVALALTIAVLTLALFYGLWFGYSWYRRAHSTAQEQSEQQKEALPAERQEAGKYS